jgi:hypothetical protein
MGGAHTYGERLHHPDKYLGNRGGSKLRHADNILRCLLAHLCNILRILHIPKIYLHDKDTPGEHNRCWAMV